MSKLLGYVLVGLGSAAITGGATWYITRRVVSKKVKDECKVKYESDLASQLNACRDYYKRKIHEADVECTEFPEDGEDVKTYDSKEEAETKNDINGVVIRGEGWKKRASEIAQEMEVQNYHKMYGEPTVKAIFDEDDDDDLPDIKPTAPYCIRKSVFYKEDEGFDEVEDYAVVELLYFTEDFIRKPDGEKEYLEIIYCNGYADDHRDAEGNIIPITVDDPWRERVIKPAEVAAILGQDWRNHFGDDTWDPSTRDGFDYDANEVCVRNNALKTDFIIIREHSMFKVAIEGLEPGDPYDYDKIR